MPWDRGIITYSLESIMIKQLQLRGISRSPSDRMSEDGGLDESLNLYIDSTESAPVLVPEDVTGDLDLPDYLQAERVFVHKTTAYENYIIQEGTDLSAVVNKEPSHIVALQENEKVLDINSIGNILIVATSSSMHYILWKGNEYKYIGNKLPLPTVRFETEVNNREYVGPVKTIGQFFLDNNPDPPGKGLIGNFNQTAWEEAARGICETEGANEYLISVHNTLWGMIQERKAYINKWGHFCCPRFVRYAIKLYDGSYIYHSVPILIGAGSQAWVEARGYSEELPSGMRKNRIDFTINQFYKAVAKLINWDVEGWEDIISGIDIFISTDITFPAINAPFESIERDGGGIIYFRGDKEAFETTKKEVLSKSNFYKVCSVGVRELSKLRDGIDLHDNDFVGETSLLVQQEQLTSDYMSNHGVTASRMETFNNSLVVNSQSISLPDAPYELNGLVPGMGASLSSYKMKFHIRRNTGEEYSVLAKTYDGKIDFVTPQFSVFDPLNPDAVDNTEPYAWIAYPDVNCYKVELEREGGSMITIEMEQHPSLYCSYAFIGLGKQWAALPGQGQLDINEERSSYSVGNQVMVSMINNPFVFPLEGRFSFQSKVQGIAIATTALSQGQFGQFPFYVFTEDGVWAMETAADGSFVTNKPLSRDVCVNRNSITSIDNAVVFVTDKGVMLLSGSQMVNISPFMNGRHYVIDEAAERLISNNEEYKGLVPAIKDETPFMAFMKNASIAYDYSGQRLICIDPDKEYQYIYKLDTQTWHKVAHGLDLKAVLNSYPECLVQGEKEGERPEFWLTESLDGDKRNDVEEIIGLIVKNLQGQNIELFLDGKEGLFVGDEEERDELDSQLQLLSVGYELRNTVRNLTRIYDFSTVLDGSRPQSTEKGVIVTRPLELGYADVKKVIKDIRIRGQFAKGHVKYILQGSDDGVHYYSTQLKQKSWKLFRIIIVCSLDKYERISWIDIDFDIRYNNRLR